MLKKNNKFVAKQICKKAEKLMQNLMLVAELGNSRNNGGKYCFPLQFLWVLAFFFVFVLLKNE